MARLIAIYEPAVLLSVEKRDGTEDRVWDWRLGYIGKPGCLSVWESERKHPGQRFLHLNSRSTDELKTGCGEITEDSGRLSIATKHSKYIFLIGAEAEAWQERRSESLETERFG